MRPLLKRPLFILFFLIFAAVPAYGEQITLSAESTFTITGSESEVKITGTYTMVNQGDAAALGSYPTLSLGEWSWAGAPADLRRDAKHTWEIEAIFPKSLLACGGTPQCPLTLPTRGLFPLLVRRHYSDGNGYKFSAADVIPVEIGPIDQNYAAPLRERSVSAAFSFSGSQGELKLKNQGVAPVRAQLSYFGTKELVLPTAPSIIEVPAGVPMSEKVNAQNFSGLAGCSYATFAVLQWEQNGMRITEFATARFEIQSRWDGTKILAGGFLLTLQLGLILRARRR